MVACPICSKPVQQQLINDHLDSDCKSFVDGQTPPTTQRNPKSTITNPSSNPASTFFSLRNTHNSFSEDAAPSDPNDALSPVVENRMAATAPEPVTSPLSHLGESSKRGRDISHVDNGEHARPSKKTRISTNAPLAERMRPRSLSQITGQSLVGPDGILTKLIQNAHIPSMILWGGSGTGKTTIARIIASNAGARFVEINSTSSGVAECKRIFSEARNELNLTGRRTIIFCDEIHRFSKSQQDVFLGPVESGVVTLIGATTENPSFKVVNALLSRCRVFTLEKLSDDDVVEILKRAMREEMPDVFGAEPDLDETNGLDDDEKTSERDTSCHLLREDEYALIKYLAAFADGDARTGLNLLELALDLCRKPGVSSDEIKKSLTKTLVYDRAGDQHYDTISAFHKSVRGGDADAALYYLARMLQSGEDPLYVARRMIVIASEDVGLADNSMLSLATATYAAAEKIGMPECRINLGHCAVALALAPKSVRAYRGLSAAYAALAEPGVAGMPIPYHIRNAPTKLMKELGYGKEYKYNPDFVDGRIVQDYLPEKLIGRKFLGIRDLGEEIDPQILELDETALKAKEAEECRRRYVTDDGDVILNPDGD